MPSLRAGLNTAQRERATQLALASCDSSWAASWRMPPGKRVADHAEPGGSRAASPSADGLAAPKSLAA